MISIGISQKKKYKWSTDIENIFSLPNYQHNVI